MIRRKKSEPHDRSLQFKLISVPTHPHDDSTELAEVLEYTIVADSRTMGIGTICYDVPMCHRLTKSLGLIALLTGMTGCGQVAKNGQSPTAAEPAANSSMTEDERL